ncbi:uncharacterized protein LOC122524415 isoform X1 [Polistes fuscatus]|uniref:uncharacterized protein LOC122524415 isoform X1 n=3 Tax=Polistes fuscatus TaxID=30207 RepID=UPI001CA98685|nr:uncharacterized protein LOC122524415 isoform X1 [Polistes fuscatus]
MEQTGDRPQWLLELENRKRKPRLAHEAGAGAPCMICNALCPGLDLHFWRKTCKICKCSRDDHDVVNDDFPQFDLLFGPSGKSKRKPMLLAISNKKQANSEIKFDWIPPDTTKELATDYMNALPIEKLPISGSNGAILRKQLLQKQLPLHDIDHKACDELSEVEKKELENYVENLKKYVGQGKVIKMLGARPFDRSLMTPANATDMQRLHSQNKSQISVTIPQLRTPSSFAKNIPYLKTPYENRPDAKVNAETKDNERNISDNKYSNPGSFHKLVNSSIPTYDANSELPTICQHEYCEPLYCKHAEINSCSVPMTNHDKKLKHTEQKNLTHRNNVDLQTEPLNIELSKSDESQEMNLQEVADNILANALLPPSAINVHDIVSSTLDKDELMFIRDKLNSKYSMQDNSQGSHTRSFPHNKGVDKASIVDSQQNLLPIGSTSKITDTNKNDQQLGAKPITAEKRVSKPLSEVIQSTSAGNIAPNFIHNKANTMHLRNKPCNAILQPSQVHNADSLENIPISSINSPEKYDTNHKEVLTKSESSTSPSDIENTNCVKGKLSGIKNVQPVISYSENLHNQVFPYEVNCKVNQSTESQPDIDALNGAVKGLTVETTKAQNCEKCKKEINVGDVVITVDKAKNILWHPGCFVCSVCDELLVDLVYFYYKNKLYCGRDLAALLGIPRCFACDELIFVREYTVAEGHNYHVKHFCCWDCDIPLAGRQYISENDHPLCLPCYQNTYAKTCNACNAVIAADQQGVAIKNLNFHATEMCFCCYMCKKYLLNSRMAVKEDKLFCSKDCISKFSN